MKIILGRRGKNVYQNPYGALVNILLEFQQSRPLPPHRKWAKAPSRPKPRKKPFPPTYTARVVTRTMWGWAEECRPFKAANKQSARKKHFFDARIVEILDEAGRPIL